jgi:hypothetical protein
MMKDVRLRLAESMMRSLMRKTTRHIIAREGEEMIMRYSLGMKLAAASDSATPGMVMEITKVGLRDDDGLEACEITFADGEKVVAALAALDEGIESGMKVIG